MGGIPALRVAQFEMGNTKGKFPLEVSMLIEEQCQIRNTAMEAGRIAANRVMSKTVGSFNYRLKLRVYPHNILRENKQATGAGADRVSDGMRKAFGKPVWLAARVKPGQKIFTVWTNPEHLDVAKKALKKAGQKMPSPIRIEVTHLDN